MTMAETALAPLASADEVEMTLHDIAQRHHEQERQIEELQNLLKKATEEIATQTKRAEVAEKKVAAMISIGLEKAPPPILSSVPLPEQQTSVLKNPMLADSFVL